MNMNVEMTNKNNEESRINGYNNIAKAPMKNNNHGRGDEDSHMLRQHNDNRHRDNDRRWSPPGNNDSIEKIVPTVPSNDYHSCPLTIMVHRTLHLPRTITNYIPGEQMIIILMVANFMLAMTNIIVLVVDMVLLTTINEIKHIVTINILV